MIWTYLYDMLDQPYVLILDFDETPCIKMACDIWTPQADSADY